MSTSARDVAPAHPASSTQTTSRPSHHELPVEPLVTIEPSRTWIVPNLRTLWAYRELLYFLTWRDVKVRYKQTALGVAWAVLQPLFTMLIFTILFGRLAGLGARTGGIPYPVFAYAALLPWTFFSNAVTNSGNSLAASAHLVTKVYFPRVIIPGAAVAAGIVDFVLGLVVFVGLMIYYAVPLSWHLLMLPGLLALITLLAFGIGMWTSALNVKYRDVRHALPFVIQLWMFVSPIIYPTNMIPTRWRWLIAMNPLTGIIDGFRATLLAQPFNWSELAFSVVLTAAILACAFYYFRTTERKFADII